MGCELEFLPRRSRKEFVPPFSATAPGSGRDLSVSDIIYDRRTSETNKSEKGLTPHSNSEMASEDNKSALNADQNIEHGCVREQVESIDLDNATIGDKSSSDTSDTNTGKNEQSDGSYDNKEQKDSDCQLPEEDIRNKTLRDLETLKSKLDTCTDIPSILYDVTLNCLKPSTIDYLSYHLDPESEVLTPDGRCKDYRGLAEWIGLETVFIKYVTRSSHLLKTKEVLSKWLTLEEEPCPNLKNLRQCLLDIERPDVLEDMSIKIALDAVSWKITEYEAQSERESVATDTSWQLTRHDVVTGKKSYYTCCLVYADEDEGMAQILIDLYKSVYSGASFFLPQYDLKQGKFTYDTTAAVIEERCGGKVIFIISEYFFASNVCRFTVNYCKEMESFVSGKKTMYTACLLYADEDELMAQLIIKLYKTAYKHALFFLPQFDLKHGKYILDTTAKVIDERCDKKVVFLLSEYFYASQICQFAVNYAAAHGTGHGNLIPFHLTRNVTSVPNVLKGISGIRWFRKGTRQHTWNILTDSLLGDKISNKAEFASVKDAITEMVEKDKDYYLQDPPYDCDVGPPGEPIQVDEPEEVIMSPLLEFKSKNIKSEEEMQSKQEKNTKWKFLTQIKKVIFEKVLRQQSKLKNSLPFSPSQETPMQTFKITSRYDSNCETNYQTSLPSKGNEESDDGMFGAVGGSKTCVNDLNVRSESQSKDKNIVNLNIPQLKSTESGQSVTVNCNAVCTQNIKNKQCKHDSCIKQSSDFCTKDSSSLLLPQENLYRSRTSEIDPSHTTGTISDKDGDQELELETQALLIEERGEGTNIDSNRRP